MERLAKTAWVILIAIFVILSCTKDDEIITPENIEETVSKGKWEVVYYWDSDENKTELFSGFIYEFNDRGVAHVTNLSKTIEGNWSTGSDENTIKLYLNYGSVEPYEELNEDWHVVERTSSRIHLKNNSHEGSPDYLTFEKL